MRVIILLLLSCSMLFSIYAEAQNDCGCGAALRYDVYKQKRDFYSEMLLARDISQEDFTNKRIEADASLSILGVKIGANGEKVDEVKKKYAEKLFTTNLTKEMTDYETVVTPNIAYETFQKCMQSCIDKTPRDVHGLYAYKVGEDADSITIELYYNGEQRAKKLPVSYKEGNKKKTVSILPNTYKLVTIPRKVNQAFSVFFETGQYKSKPVEIKPYKPIRAIATVTYTNKYTEPGPKMFLSKDGADNHDEDCNGMEELRGKIVDENKAKFIDVPDGVHRIDGNCVVSQDKRASVIIFKFTAPPGFKLRNPKPDCPSTDKQACGNQEAQYLRNDGSVVVYMTKTYSRPVLITLEVETYKDVSQPDYTQAFTTGDMISFIVPKTAVLPDAIISYNEHPIPLGKSDTWMKMLTNAPRDGGNYLIYDYQVLKFD